MGVRVKAIMTISYASTSACYFINHASTWRSTKWSIHSEFTVGVNRISRDIFRSLFPFSVSRCPYGCSCKKFTRWLYLSEKLTFTSIIRCVINLQVNSLVSCKVISCIGQNFYASVPVALKIWLFHDYAEMRCAQFFPVFCIFCIANQIIYSIFVNLENTVPLNNYSYLLIVEASKNLTHPT